MAGVANEPITVFEILLLSPKSVKEGNRWEHGCDSISLRRQWTRMSNEFLWIRLSLLFQQLVCKVTCEDRIKHPHPSYAPFEHTTFVYFTNRYVGARFRVEIRTHAFQLMSLLFEVWTIIV